MSAERSERSGRLEQLGPSGRIYAGLLVAGAVIGLVANPLHPHTVDTDPAATRRAIGESGIWVGLHLAIIAAVLLVTGGLVGLAHLLEGGPAVPLARVGLAAALVGVALVAVSTSMDGFANKALAVQSAGAAGAEAAT